MHPFASLPLAFAACCALAAPAAAQTLVRDINATSPGAHSGPQNLTAAGGRVYFTADDGVHGREVWWTDGTTATLAADIRPGPLSSNPGIVAQAFSGGVLVIANDGVSGAELHWVLPGSDVLLELNPGPLGTPFGFGVVHDTEFWFVAWTPATGYELWATDGVSVRLVREIVSGTGDGVANYAGMALIGDTLLFNGQDPLHGMELWRSDGTAAGTMLVKDIAPGPTPALGYGNPLVGDGIQVWFMAYEPTTGNELWTSDGTAAGTVLVHDLVPGTGSSQPQPILVHERRCYLRAQTPATGTELFTAYASSGQVTLLKDLAPGTPSSNVTSLHAAGDLVFFTDGSISSGTEALYRTDGTPAGTFPVRGPGPPLQLTGIVDAVGVGTRVLFQGVEAGLTGNEPWLSDGTVAGTVRLFDLVPGATGSFPDGFRVVGNQVVFAADDVVHGRELFAMPLSLTRGCIVETLLPGCPGSSGRRPRLEGVGIPRFGSSFSLRLSGAAANAFAGAMLGVVGVPGATGCALQVPAPITMLTTVTSPSGTGHFAMPVPNTPTLLSFEVHAQAAVLDAGGGFLGIASLSNGLRVVVGDR